MKKLVFCFLFIGILISCDESEDSIQTTSELNGKWELQNAVCFCFYPEDFDFSAHKIEFDNDSGTLTIEHSAETFFITESGSYKFQVQGNKIVINNTWEFTFEIQENILILNYVDNPEIADDEVTLTYKKED